MSGAYGVRASRVNDVSTVYDLARWLFKIVEEFHVEHRQQFDATKPCKLDFRPMCTCQLIADTPVMIPPPLSSPIVVTCRRCRSAQAILAHTNPIKKTYFCPDCEHDWEVDAYGGPMVRADDVDARE